ncbi:TetR/AcrR family transcriptional regulator [Cohnella zeiphila]|uniref:TetR/AcrR family transcriptional regulator n=1 Tax=Cohnella zeiphila TaxID=2761120 RepID=A0A7X0SMH5_9BACL|nr:TetR/AcrR family transcriptional regulator [Cohnella zeiphila]MBB6731579.1 TetR/AcrR family transcriptional regulator [Cohnella zeiphila]
MPDTKPDGESTGTRRRGKQLEEAILQAAWDELSAAGYANLTIEGVADRARTSKTVIYRRWPNRAELVRAAVLFRSPYFEGEKIPDTGELRGDCLSLLRQHPFKEVKPDIVRGLLADLDGLPLARFINHQGKERGFAIKTILKRAEQRGEIQTAELHPRIIALPTDLLRQEVILTHEPIPDETIVEIVDVIFLPLVYRSQPG